MSSSRSFSRDKIRRLVGTAVLLSFVIVLQLMGTFIKIGPIPMSLVLIPIALGSCIYGPKTGAFLGFAFGVVVMIGAITGSDSFSFVLFTTSPVGLIVVVMGKAVAAGWCSGWLYHVMKEKNLFWATVIAAASAPVVNTGIFCIGMLTILRENLIEFAGGTSLFEYTFLTLAGLNFVGELVINVVLGPVLIRLFREKTA